jgi:hypothetical protein
LVLQVYSGDPEFHPGETGHGKPDETLRDGFISFVFNGLYYNEFKSRKA